MKKVMVFGTFDLLHKGHINLFSQARKFGDVLIAVIARDVNVKKRKDITPEHDEKERQENVKKYVDYAYLGNINDHYKIIIKIKPDTICLGYDQKANLAELKKFKIPIIRLKSYKKHIYKSSHFRKKLKG